MNSVVFRLARKGFEPPPFYRYDARGSSGQRTRPGPYLGFRRPFPPWPENSLETRAVGGLRRSRKARDTFGPTPALWSRHHVHFLSIDQRSLARLDRPVPPGQPRHGLPTWRVQIQGAGPDLGETPILVPLKNAPPPGAYQLMRTKGGAPVPAQVLLDNGTTYLVNSARSRGRKRARDVLP